MAVDLPRLVISGGGWGVRLVSLSGPTDASPGTGLRPEHGGNDVFACGKPLSQSAWLSRAKTSTAALGLRTDARRSVERLPIPIRPGARRFRRSYGLCL